jgi:hypothetical protein
VVVSIYSVSDRNETPLPFSTVMMARRGGMERLKWSGF